MGVKWMRTATIANGKVMEAISWGKEMSGYCEKKYGLSQISVMMDSFGPVGTLRWMVDFPSLADCEKVQTQMMMDQDYWKMINKAISSNLFIDGKTHDIIARVL
jgi:hypothetical protein